MAMRRNGNSRIGGWILLVLVAGGSVPGRAKELTPLTRKVSFKWTCPKGKWTNLRSEECGMAAWEQIARVCPGFAQGHSGQVAKAAFEGAHCIDWRTPGGSAWSCNISSIPEGLGCSMNQREFKTCASGKSNLAVPTRSRPGERFGPRFGNLFPLGICVAKRRDPKATGAIQLPSQFPEPVGGLGGRGH